MSTGEIPRDPAQDARTLRFMQQIQQRLNALERQGEMIRTEGGGFTTMTAQSIIYQQVFGK